MELLARGYGNRVMPGCDAAIVATNIPVSRRPAVAMANHLFDVITRALRERGVRADQIDVMIEANAQAGVSSRSAMPRFRTAISPPSISRRATPSASHPSCAVQVGEAVGDPAGSRHAIKPPATSPYTASMRSIRTGFIPDLGP
jgi:hypothetical protein